MTVDEAWFQYFAFQSLSPPPEASSVPTTEKFMATASLRCTWVITLHHYFRLSWKRIVEITEILNPLNGHIRINISHTFPRQPALHYWNNADLYQAKDCHMCSPPTRQNTSSLFHERNYLIKINYEGRR